MHISDDSSNVNSPKETRNQEHDRHLASMPTLEYLKPSPGGALSDLEVLTMSKNLASSTSNLLLTDNKPRTMSDNVHLEVLSDNEVPNDHEMDDEDEDDEEEDGEDGDKKDDDEEVEEDEVIPEQHREDTHQAPTNRDKERGRSSRSSNNSASSATNKTSAAAKTAASSSSNTVAGTTIRSRDTSSSAKSSKPRKKKRWCTVNLTSCKYDCVRRSCRKFGMREVGDDEDWMLYWCDTSVALHRVMEMKKYQKINHFPGMAEICRKDLLARNMNRMLKLFPKDYAIFPKSWCLPADYGDFQAYTRQKKNKTFILKPESGSQGKGIWICKNPKDIKPNDHAVCQQYISKPLLVDGFKFDMRIYVCVTSCDPLRIYVWRDGLARFATVKYVDPTAQNLDELYMHLTNYAINKSSKEFIRDEEHGSKRRLSTLYRQMEEKGIDVDKLKTDINDIIIKTLIAAHPVLKHNYRTCFSNHIKGSACFEILGFDVLLDRKLRPIVLEVNHSPSFTTDSALDRELKDNIVFDTLNMLNFAPTDRKRCIEEEKRRVQDRLLKTKSRDSRKQELSEIAENTTQQMMKYELEHGNGYYRIYPPLPDSGLTEAKYAKFFEHSGSLFSETVASKARGEAAKQMREDLKQKEASPSHKNGGGHSKASAQHKSDNNIRPESPGSSKKRMLHRPVSQRLLQPKRRDGARPQSISRISNEVTPVNNSNESKIPQEINEEEELERQGLLLQRDSLIRSLGVVELVHKLLQSGQAANQYPVLKDKVESFREKYNLAQYAGGPLSVQKSVAGVNAQVSKNLPVPTLPHNLAARTKLLAFTKRGSSVAGHYDRVGSGGAYDDAASKTDSGLLIKTNNNHQRFLLDTRSPLTNMNTANVTKNSQHSLNLTSVPAPMVHKGLASAGGGAGAGYHSSSDLISASFHGGSHNNSGRPALKSAAVYYFDDNLPAATPYLRAESVCEYKKAATVTVRVKSASCLKLKRQQYGPPRPPARNDKQIDRPVDPCALEVRQMVPILSYTKRTFLRPDLRGATFQSKF